MTKKPRSFAAAFKRTVVYVLTLCMALGVMAAIIAETAPTAEATEFNVGDANAFRNAVNNSANGDIIRLTANISMGSAGVTFSGNKSVVLDLNGKELNWTVNNAGDNITAITVNSGVTLTIRSASTSGKIICYKRRDDAYNVSTNVVFAVNHGTIILESGEISVESLADGKSSSTGSSGYDCTGEAIGIDNRSGGQFYMNGGSFTVYAFSRSLPKGALGPGGNGTSKTVSRGIVNASGATAEINAGKFLVKGRAEVHSKGKSGAQYTDNTVYGVENSGTFRMNGGTFDVESYSPDTQKPKLTLKQYFVNGNSPIYTGGNVTSYVSRGSNYESTNLTNKLLSTDAYIDAYNNTISLSGTDSAGSKTGNGESLKLYNGTPYAGSTVVRVEYDYMGTITSVPNPNIGTVSVSSNVGFKRQVTNPSNSSHLFHVASGANITINPTVTEGYTYYYHVENSVYIARAASNANSSSTSSIPDNTFTINADNNYVIRVVFRPTTPSTPTIAINNLEPVYTGAPRGYNTLFNISVFVGTENITSYYNVDGSTPNKIAVTYEFKIQGTSTWSTGFPTDAGTYDIRVTLASDTVIRNGGRNVNATSAQGTVTIQKATPNPGNPTVTLTYGQSLSQATIQNAPGVEGTWVFDTPDVIPNVSNSNTTLYGATFVPANSNYVSIHRTFTVTVNKKTVEVTARPITQNYGTNPRTYEIVYDGFVLGENENTPGVFSTASRPTASCAYYQYADVGQYPITISLAGVSSTNYNFVLGPTAYVTVTPAPLTVTATAVNREYDGTVNVTVNFGSLVGILNNDNVYLSSNTTVGTVADKNVGSGKEVTFTIPALAGAKAGNYSVSVSNLPVRVNITKATPTPPAVSFPSMVYDPTRQLSSLELPQGVTWDNPSTVPTVNVTSYPATYTPADTVNYNTVSFNIPLTITKAPVVIKADNKSTTYGQAEPAFTYTFIGYLGPDAQNPPPRTGNITASTDYNRDDPAKRGVGTYTITLSGNPQSDNYYYTFENGTLTVNKATVNVTVEDKTVVYGSAAPQFTFVYNLSDFFYNDTPANSVDASGAVFSCDYTVGSPVANYQINLSGLSSANYTFNYIPGTLTVTKATLKVRANEITIPYGSPVPAFTVSYIGWVGGDSDSNNDLTGSPAFTCDYVVGSPVTPEGYIIQVARGTLNSNNYNFEFERGVLRVVKADPVITQWPTATVTYLDNLSDPEWGEAVTSVPGTFIFDDMTTVPTFEEGRTYPATFRPQDSVNYNEVKGEILVIVNRRSISGSVTISGVAMVSSSLTADVTGITPVEAQQYLNYSWVVNGTEISTSNTTGELIEDYIDHVAVLTVTAYGPFKGTITINSPVITKFKLTPTLADLIFAPPVNIDYDGQNHPLDVRPRNDVGQFTVLYNGSPTPPRRAGQYVITVDFAGNEDYAATVGVYLGTFEIRKVDLYATYTVNTKVYDRTATASISNLKVTPLGNDVVTLNTTGAVATFNNANAGENKPVTLTGVLLTGPDAGNYNLKIQNTTGTILPREVSITATPVSRVYNGTTEITLQFTNGLIGVIPPDDVTCSQYYATAYVETPDVGTDKPLVDPEYWTLPPLIGADASNYKLKVVVERPMVTITKANPTYVLPELPVIVYDPEITLADIPLTGGWSWVNPNTVPTADRTSYLATFTPSDTHNYNSLNVQVPLTTQKATVYVRPNNVENLVYGSPVPSFTLSFSGFKGNDNALNSITGGNVNFNTNYTQYSDVGEYLISLTGGYTSTNYQFVLQTGTITVVKKDVTAVATAVSRPYAPANTNVTVNFGSISGIVNNDDVSLSYTSTTGTIDSPNVGLRNVTFTPPTLVGSKAKNYNLIINTNIVVEIVKANPTGVVFPSQATVEYGLPLSAAQFKNDFEIPVAVPGHFVFEDYTIVPDEIGSGRSYMVLFVPDDSGNYNSISQLVPLVVKIRILNPEVSIVGKFEQEQIIYASVKGIPDDAKRYIKYTWFRGDPDGPNGTFTVVGTDATYQLTQQDVGQQIYLRVSIGDNVIQPYFAPDQTVVSETIKEITLSFWEKLARWFYNIIASFQKLFDIAGRSLG
ncbi:MAG TPA: MBG domain-containing protein [Clostridiales bacterium]|nr:MBG domain-containing protein [Clostridiales bacterium]